MSRRRKFRPGPVITSLPLAVQLIEDGRFFYWYQTGRPTSPKWLRNLSLATLAANCRHGRFRLAEPNDG